MSQRCITSLLVLVAVLAVAASPRSGQAQYRGTPAGWPYVASGYYASAAPSYGYPQPYMVARPVMPAQYAGMPGQYAPVTAYANPYAAAYNMPAYARPAATTAYYAPPANQYAPSGSYNYAPAMRVAYMAPQQAYMAPQYAAPQYAYRPAYQPATVYAYRPVTVYQPGTGQPVTCLQPIAPTTCCQPAPQPSCQQASGCGGGWFSWLHPFQHSWFSHSWFRGGCGSGGCGAPPPTTAYCGQPSYPTTCGTAGCAQPYYPAQPAVIVPTQPGVYVAPPVNTAPAIRSPIIGTPTVPPPPTRFNSTVPGNTFAPADIRPSLAPGATIVNPGTPVPSNTFPTPTPGFNPGPTGNFPSGSNYPPMVDPYSSGATSSGAALGTPESKAATPVGPILTQPEPPRGSALNSSVQPVPDPDAKSPPRPLNRAPQLLDPRDKTARAGDTRWAVVPAIWPSKTTSATARTEFKPYAERSYSEPRVEARPVSAPVLNPADFDDGGWKSARW